MGADSPDDVIKGGSGGIITISGGTVSASGGANAAGIGGGGANTSAFAANAYGGDGGTISISGGTITAAGKMGGADIGGEYAASAGSTTTLIGGTGAAVTVTNSPTIIAAGNDGAEHIGKGYNGSNSGTLRDGSLNDLSYLRFHVVNSLIADISGAAVIINSHDYITSGVGLTGCVVPRNSTALYHVGAASYTATSGSITPTLMNNDIPVSMDSMVATVTSSVYSVSAGGTTGEAITGVSAGTSKTVFESNITKGESHQTWNVTGVHDPVVTGDTLVVTAEDGVTQVTYTISLASNNNNGSSTHTSKPTYQPVISGIGTSGATLPVNVNTNTGNASVDLGTPGGSIFDGKETPVITVPPIPGVNNYTLNIPASSLSSSQGNASLTFATCTGSITIPANMLSGISGIMGKKAGITIGQGDLSGLPDEVKEAINGRPLVKLSLMLDGVLTEWNNPDAPVTVSIPYTPSTEELADPEHIVVWYIDSSGNVVPIPNGRYNSATGTVTFTTTHFSYYGVAYVQKTFNDLDGVKWAQKSIEDMASKGIITGTGTNDCSPAANITRADYLVLLIKTLGLTADFDDNFKDVTPGSYYYDSVGIARTLGIVEGSGDNSFNPKNNISRQDMMVMTARALEKLKEPKAIADLTVLDQFGDKTDVAGYAAESLATLVKEGLISGFGDNLNPRSCTTRAEAVVFLYRIYNKY